MPVAPVNERFPVSVIDGTTVRSQFLPVRTIWNGAENQLFAPNPAITRAVISCHGVGADAATYADRAYDAAGLAGARGETLVIAPQFANPSDLLSPDYLDVESNLLYWEGGRFSGKRSGNQAYERPVRISSFTAMDQLMSHLADSGLFPNIATIVLAGHSGGGQFALRYAFASRYVAPPEVDVRYIPMNPGTVIYTSPKRAVAGSSPVHFEEPTDEALTAVLEMTGEPLSLSELRRRYNRYGLGMQSLGGYDYLAGDTPAAMMDRFRDRAVAYLVGQNDIQVHLKAAFILQGVHRLERSRFFELHLKDEGVWNSLNHVRHEIPGVGHSGHSMMTSIQGLWYMFGFKEPITPDPLVELSPARLKEILQILERLETRVPAGGGRGREPVVTVGGGSVGNRTAGVNPLPSREGLQMLSFGTAFARNNAEDRSDPED